MPDMTVLQIDSMIAALKQAKKYQPHHTLQEAYAVWRTLASKK